MINYHSKELYKTTCYKTKYNFFQFFFSHWLLCEYFFLFPYQHVSKFWKIDKIFFEKNGENLKILTEILCQKLVVSNVISFFFFLSVFSPANHVDRHRALPLFKISGSALEIYCWHHWYILLILLIYIVEAFLLLWMWDLEIFIKKAFTFIFL